MMHSINKPLHNTSTSDKDYDAEIELVTMTDTVVQAAIPPPITRQSTFGTLPTSTQSTTPPLTVRLSEAWTKRSTLKSLSDHLFIFHLVNLFITIFTSIWYIIQYEDNSTIILNPDDPDDLRTKQLQVSTCMFFVCFHTAKSIINLAMLAIRKNRPELWNPLINQADDQPNNPYLLESTWAQSSLNRQFYKICLFIDLCFIAWTSVGGYFVLSVNRSREYVSSELFIITVGLVLIDCFALFNRTVTIIILSILYRSTGQTISWSIPYVPFPETRVFDDAMLTDGRKPMVRGLSDVELQNIPTKVFHKGCFCDQETYQSIIKSSAPSINQLADPVADETINDPSDVHLNSCTGSSEPSLDDLSVEQSNDHSHEVSVERADEEGPMCAICLTEYVDGEIVRELRCLHVFHKSCCDQWLKFKGTCCLCIRLAVTADGIIQADSTSHHTVTIASVP